MTLEDLARIAAHKQESQRQFQHRVQVCVAAGCLSSHSDRLKEGLDAEVKRRGMDHVCLVKGVGCMGPCAAGPLVAVAPQDILYQGVRPEDAPEIIESLGASPVSRLSYPTDQPFSRRQRKIVLENSGEIDPEDIDDYLAAGGYTALLKSLTSMTPPEVIEQIVCSGLRGRGGAGFPTGLKWTTVAKAPGERKFVICNADEGDPGAFMHRSLLESDPHRVLEGMTIAAYAVGAEQGYIYVRAEYPLAVKRLRAAIRQAERQHLLGKNIAETTFGFHIDVRLGAGAFVCGEETALIASIEGKRGTPARVRPIPPRRASGVAPL